MSLLSGVMTGSLGAEVRRNEGGEFFALHPVHDLNHVYHRLTWQLVPANDMTLLTVEVRLADEGYPADIDFEVTVYQQDFAGRDRKIVRMADRDDFIGPRAGFGAVFEAANLGTYQLTFSLKPEAKAAFTVWMDSLMERGLL